MKRIPCNELEWIIVHTISGKKSLKLPGHCLLGYHQFGFVWWMAVVCSIMTISFVIIPQRGVFLLWGFTPFVMHFFNGSQRVGGGRDTCIRDTMVAKVVVELKNRPALDVLLPYIPKMEDALQTSQISGGYPRSTRPSGDIYRKSGWASHDAQ